MKVAFATLVMCSFAPIAFGATEVSHSRYRDETGRLDYSWVDEAQCISKRLILTAAKTSVKEDGVTSENRPSVSMTFSTSTFGKSTGSDGVLRCDGSTLEQTTFWFGTAVMSSLDIDSNLRYARLIASS